MILLFKIWHNNRVSGTCRASIWHNIRVSDMDTILTLKCLCFTGLNNALQDQVSDLKFTYLHLLMVRCSDLLLVCYDVDLGLLLLFLQLI